MKYDIFISYKRKGTSSATAAYLYELLQQKGYNVFFDRKEMRSGKFDEQILEHISNATDIIILLEEESLFSWFNSPSPRKIRTMGSNGSSSRIEMPVGSQEEPYKSDWFCKEVMFSLGLKEKNLIPILLNGYVMPEAKDLPPEMAELSSHQALSLDISEIEEFYEKYFIEQGYLHSKPANLSLSKRFQSKGGIVGCFLFYTDVDSCDLYECGEKILTLAENNDEKHPFRYPVNFAGEHRFWAINNDSCEEVMIKCSVETNCQQYVQVQFSETRNLWALSTNEINAQNDKDLLYNWGVGLYDGTTKHDPDIALSFECLKRAINLGSEEALSFICSHGGGLITQKQAPIEVALKWYQIAAEHNNLEAQCHLGDMYFDGDVGAQDYGKAYEWYLKAAEQGDAYGQYCIGYMYYKGLGVNKDFTKALEWYLKAAEQGDTIAQSIAGLLYYFGEGVEKDYWKAFKWQMKAAEQGNADAQQRVGYMYDHGLGVGKDEVKAFEWYMKAAEQGNADAQQRVGYMYDAGLGVEQDYAKAIEWYLKSARQGYAAGQFSLGTMYENGLGVDQDYAKAMEWYLKSAEQGYAYSQCKMGTMYENGLGVEQDYAKAMEWYMKAAEQDYELAFNQIAWVYYLMGEEDKALPWAKKAIKAEPDDPDVVDTLATVYEGLGRYKDALVQFERCLQLYEEEGNEDGIKVTEEKISALKKMMKVR